MRVSVLSGLPTPHSTLLSGEQIKVWKPLVANAHAQIERIWRIHMLKCYMNEWLSDWVSDEMLELLFATENIITIYPFSSYTTRIKFHLFCKLVTCMPLVPLEFNKSMKIGFDVWRENDKYAHMCHTSQVTVSHCHTSHCSESVWPCPHRRCRWRTSPPLPPSLSSYSSSETSLQVNSSSIHLSWSFWMLQSF